MPDRVLVPISRSTERKQEMYPHRLFPIYLKFGLNDLHLNEEFHTWAYWENIGSKIVITGKFTLTLPEKGNLSLYMSFSGKEHWQHVYTFSVSMPPGLHEISFAKLPKEMEVYLFLHKKFPEWNDVAIENFIDALDKVIPIKG